jgi:pyruvoyl-dependent arginine decarboxylase (PvlArgDC)
MKWLFWILFQQVFFLRRAGYSSDNKNAYNPELIQAGGGLLNLISVKLLLQIRVLMSR